MKSTRPRSVPGRNRRYKDSQRYSLTSARKKTRRMISSLRSSPKRSVDKIWSFSGLKKSLSRLPHPDRKRLIERSHASLSLTKQAELLNISRANLYYRPVIDRQDIVAMNALDAIYTDYPFYGSRRIQYDWFSRYVIA